MHYLHSTPELMELTSTLLFYQVFGHYILWYGIPSYFPTILLKYGLLRHLAFTTFTKSFHPCFNHYQLTRSNFGLKRSISSDILHRGLFIIAVHSVPLRLINFEIIKLGLTMWTTLLFSFCHKRQLYATVKAPTYLYAGGMHFPTLFVTP